VESRPEAEHKERITQLILANHRLEQELSESKTREDLLAAANHQAEKDILTVQRRKGPTAIATRAAAGLAAAALLLRGRFRGSVHGGCILPVEPDWSSILHGPCVAYSEQQGRGSTLK